MAAGGSAIKLVAAYGLASNRNGVKEGVTSVKKIKYQRQHRHLGGVASRHRKKYREMTSKWRRSISSKYSSQSAWRNINKP